MNTLKASLSGKGELDMVVYHSKNAQSALDNVSVSLEKIFSSRAEFFSNLEILDTVKRTPDEARYIVSSFLNNRGSREGDEPTELSTQTYNKADEIAENAFLKLISRLSMALAAPIVAVGITWFGNTLWTINNSQGEMKGQINLLAQQVGQISEGKYTANDASRDAKAQTVKDGEQDRRLTTLENRVERLLPVPHQ